MLRLAVVIDRPTVRVHGRWCVAIRVVVRLLVVVLAVPSVPRAPLGDAVERDKRARRMGPTKSRAGREGLPVLIRANPLGRSTAMPIVQERHVLLAVAAG